MAYALTKLVSNMLYGIRPTDPASACAAAAALGIAALIAAWMPARRATRIDPLVALRIAFTPTRKAVYTCSAMDVERTIEFILDMQAKAEVRMAKADERMVKFDKRLEATRRLVDAGLKFVAKSQKDHAEWKKEMGQTMKELAEAQKKTDVKLDRLIDFWAKQRTNGNKK